MIKNLKLFQKIKSRLLLLLSKGTLITSFFYPILYKIIFLLLFFLLFFFCKTFQKIIIEDQIEKEIDKIESNQTSLNWKNIKNDFEFLVNKYKYLINKEKNIEEDCPIWVMWYDGIQSAPPIIKSCFQSIIENRVRHPVFLITKFNLEKYIKLPSFINEKFKNGTFSITHFSDIVRFALLSKYGGYWIDSSYFLVKPLKEENISYYTLKLNYCFTYTHPFIKCKWSGNFMAVGLNSFIATYGYIAFLFYWKKYNKLIDYYLIDYIIHIAYMNLKEFKDKIEQLPFVTCNIFSLIKYINFGFNQSYINCPFNKLARRLDFKAFNGNNLSNYGYIIEKYKINMKLISNVENI